MECAAPEVDRPKPTEDDEARKKQAIVRDISLAKTARAKSHELEPAEAERLKHIDVFRENLARDPQVKVEPLKVRIKPGSMPVKRSIRRNMPLHIEHVREYVAALEVCGMMYLNIRATWVAAPRIVHKKKAGALRMTIDSRPINVCTKSMPWPISNLDSAMFA
ncbi:hypothetical protein Ae201684P_009872 [Aphanomyces euteiches]|uniref:Uncharacterized protein n=1 Tax=Aphanomyces euteiches TaxID=100861 RepID=A0A6G0XH68_9STRA|nr:hypothetical protein Ae201684_005043 [Aphanomyces euteiches]KAH9082549.1 hypothetical protein Ae201684P_009872 [Aphanomyces euteiches]